MVKIPEHAAQVLSALEGTGFGAWCVGGCVRDSLLGRTPQDWDVTTAAVPERVLAIFGDRRAHGPGPRHRHRQDRPAEWWR